MWEMGHAQAHERRVMSGNNVSEPMVTITAILPGSTWSVLLLRTVMQEAMRCIFPVVPELRIRVYVDDMKLSQQGISCALLDRTRNLCEMFKNLEMATVHLELSVTEGGKEGKSP